MKKGLYITFLVIAVIIAMIIGSYRHFAISIRPWRSDSGTNGNGGSFSATEETGEFGFDEEVSDLEIQLCVGDVQIETGSTCQVTWGCNHKELVPECSITDGKLLIKQDESAKRLIATKKTCKIVITLPTDKKPESMKVDLGVGDMELTACQAASADLDIGTGDVRMEGVTFDRGLIDLGTGDIKANDSKLTSMTVEVGTGDIKMENVSFSELSTDIGTGDLKLSGLEEIRDMELELEIGTGGILVDGEEKGDKMHLHGEGSKLSADIGTGDIELES